MNHPRRYRITTVYAAVVATMLLLIEVSKWLH